MKTRVGVLRGGPSSEYEVSLRTGDAILKNLPPQYHPVDIFIDRGGVWHLYGVPHEPHRALAKVDVVWNALHGEYGEDGGVQELLDAHAVFYTGSGRFASAMAMNKAAAKGMLLSAGVKTPYYRILRREHIPSVSAAVLKLYRTFPQPSIVKPLGKGSSVGMAVARSAEELAHALDGAFAVSDAVLLEEFIQGREATCGVVDGFRGERHYTLLPIEICPPPESPFFDYYAKYSGQSREVCPGNFSRREMEELQELARTVHAALELRHYSRSDFIVHPRRGIYFLEVNTLPGLTAESLLPKALRAVGCEFPQFLDHVLTLALVRR
ncbi:MAG: D-alanine-D-alanine ligase [Parcubacteria group bacterium Greene0416_79]|nr:MAG: D-alanine-D-alanine ligase [Parcubacteria group bacterium Greene0416_79]